jgi:hypothetical protein
MRKEEEEKVLENKITKNYCLLSLLLFSCHKNTAPILFTPQNSTSYIDNGCESDKSSIVCTAQNGSSYLLCSHYPRLLRTPLFRVDTHFPRTLHLTKRSQIPRAATDR